LGPRKQAPVEGTAAIPCNRARSECRKVFGGRGFDGRERPRRVAISTGSVSALQGLGTTTAAGEEEIDARLFFVGALARCEARGWRLPRLFRARPPDVVKRSGVPGRKSRCAPHWRVCSPLRQPLPPPAAKAPSMIKQRGPMAEAVEHRFVRKGPNRASEGKLRNRSQ